MSTFDFGGQGPQGPPAGPDPSAGGGPPASISVPQADSGPSGDQTPEALIKQALDLLDQAKHLEPDDVDTGVLAKIEAELHQYIGNQQKMVDSATGAGPGAKLVRKASGGGNPAQGAY